MKCFIIRIKDNNISEDLANELISSLNAHNVEYNLFDAVYGEQIQELWSKENLKFYHKQNPNRKLPGVQGCFLSHYSLWKQCLDDNEPYLIFEHDAVVIRNIPEQIYSLDHYDVINLDYASREEPNYEDHLNLDKGFFVKNWKPDADQKKKKGLISLANKSSIKGLHSYVIFPSGAKKLIDRAQDHGTFPADIHVNSVFVNLGYTVTSYARINPKYWINAKVGSINSFTRVKQ